MHGVQVNVNGASSSASSSQSLSSLTLKESSPSMHNNENISSIHNDVTAMLPSLLKEFKDVFPDDLPPGLPLESTIMHGMDLMAGSQPPYCLSALEASEVEK